MGALPSEKRYKHETETWLGNKGIKYLLMVIDIFSKFGWIEPLKDKRGERAAKAFGKIFKAGRRPRFLWTDKGKEFYNKDVKELLKNQGITL